MPRASVFMSLATAGVLAAAIAGCGSSSPHHATSHRSSTSSQSAGSSRANLTRAAFVSAGEPGYAMTFSLSEDLGSGGKLTATGSGSFSVAAKAGSLTISMTIPGAAASLGQLSLQAVIRGAEYYIKLPSQLDTYIPGAKPWLSLNVDDAGKAADLPGMGSIVSSEQSLADPGQYLSFLEGVSATGVENLGSTTVDGVQTTHYRADLDLAKLPDAVPAADRQAAKQFVQSLEQKTKLGLVPIDAWIDSENRVRRIALHFTATVPASSSATQTVTTDLIEDFTSYGPQPVPAAPPAGQTTDLMSLLSGLTTSGASSGRD